MNKKLQVFVSSTYTDLIEERQAAVEAILDAGHIPAGMELFKAGNESQLKTIYKWIDESDVYMLILGGRYGSIEEKSGKSYTQLEYEYAISRDIPVFAVVLSESFLTNKINILGLNNTIEQNASNKYQAFKSLVMSKIVREVDDCKDIKLSIHTTINEFMYTYDFIGWMRSKPKNHLSYMPANYETLIQENETLKQQLNEVKNPKANVPYNIDEIYLLKLIDIFQNKTFETLYSHSTNIRRNINAIDEFIEYYDRFCKGIEKPNRLQNTLYVQPIYYEICPYFENFNLLKNKKGTYIITDLGKSFYSLLKTKGII